MTNKHYSKFNLVINNIYKNITLFVFLLLPKRVSAIFASLSILSAILSIQSRKINLNEDSIEKLEKLLNISFCNEILLFPNYTVDWFWNEKFLSQEITIDNRKLKLFEAIICEEIFNNNIRYILNIFVDNLPKILKFKLNLNNNIEKIYLKHNIMRSMLYV